MKQDFRCPFCNGSTKQLSNEMMNRDVRFINLTDKQLVYCKKHKFLLFEKRWIGGGFFSESSVEWNFLKCLEPTDFECKYCINWSLKKGIEDEDGIRKRCELGLQKGREHEGWSFCNSCDKFKYIEKVKV
ncbi:MAG: hypothetical protein AABW56_01465 [Nanoarchaeota archaeon]